MLRVQFRPFYIPDQGILKEIDSAFGKRDIHRHPITMPADRIHRIGKAEHIHCLVGIILNHDIQRVCGPSGICTMFFDIGLGRMIHKLLFSYTELLDVLFDSDPFYLYLILTVIEILYQIISIRKCLRYLIVLFNGNQRILRCSLYAFQNFLPRNRHAYRNRSIQSSQMERCKRIIIGYDRSP